MQRFNIYFIILSIGILFSGITSAATLNWEACADADLVGYQIYCGNESGVYTDTIDVGNVVEYSLSAMAVGHSYYLAVSAYDHWGNQSELSTEIPYEPQVATDVDDHLNAMPRSFALQQNYPNPFNPETTILYSLDESGPFELAVYNLRGQCVKVLLDDNAPYQGTKGSAMWDGRDSSGQSVASGVYFYRLRQGRKIKTKQMSLTR
ncbi:T9SS type A sorting domain-containing protein [bacterium]|nr:T9SS type A sorting domain-containing protein [bacterium]